MNRRAKKLAGLILISQAILLLAIPSVISAEEIKQQILDALNAGDTTSAISLLENDIKLDPSYEYNYYILGQIYEKRRKWTKALEQYQIALDKKSKFYEGLYALGLVQLKLGMIDEAEKSFQKGLKKSRDMKGQFHNGMGLVYLARGEYNEADREIRQAIIIDPSSSEYHLNLGDVNFANKVYPLAISEYEKALEADTASKEVYYRWAEACLELKDYTCALEKLSIVLTKDSMHAEAWMKAGGIYYKAARSTRDPQEFKKRFIETIGSYEKYIELSQAEPDSFTGRAYYETAMSYVFIGGYAKAQEYFRTVLSIPVEPRDIYFYFARSFQGDRENPQYDSALFYYEMHKEWVSQQDADYETGISDTELYRRMGECYESTKDWFNTINYYKRSLEYDSTQGRLLYGVAVAYNYTGDYMNALIYYMKRIALGVDERYWSIYYNAATSALYLLDKGGIAMMEEEDLVEDEEAELDIEEPANPLEGVDLARLAVEYLEKITNDYWEQVSSKENYMKTGIKALGMLGSTYLYQLNDCTNGVKNYQRVLEYEPENCEALKSLGYAYFGGICTSNYTRALDYLGQAKSCYKKEGKVECDQEMVDLELWIAQTYQFRAIDRREAKQKEASKLDFKAAYDGYLAVLKCDPGNTAAEEGRDQVKYEY